MIGRKEGQEGRWDWKGRVIGRKEGQEGRRDWKGGSEGGDWEVKRHERMKKVGEK